MKNGDGKRAVVLLSGGLDSSTCLAIAASEGFACYTLACDYGQRQRIEIDMAARQSAAFCAREHKVITLDLRKIGGSALTTDAPVPKGDTIDIIPPTYVPARNLILLSIGLAWAEVLGAEDLFFGANQIDFSGYPDCRAEFVQAFEQTANLATRMGAEGRRIRVRAPLLDLDKAAIIRRAMELGVDLKNTHTCYDPSGHGKACGKCPSCRLRLKGFAGAGIPDPLAYETRAGRI